MGWVFDADRRVEKLERMFRFVLHEATIGLGATYLAAGSCACWTPPGAPEWPEDRGARFLTMMNDGCDADEVARLLTMNHVMEEHHPTEDHWYLGMIATEPEARGRGIGGSLMREALTVVDAAHLPAYLESTNPRNISLYVRHGFRVTGELKIPDGPSMTAMWRDPT
jgi:ribosomal protein S18 acetylase RimI-like enzyme